MELLGRRDFLDEQKSPWRRVFITQYSLENHIQTSFQQDTFADNSSKPNLNNKAKENNKQTTTETVWLCCRAHKLVNICYQLSWKIINQAAN